MISKYIDTFDKDTCLYLHFKDTFRKQHKTVRFLILLGKI